MRSDEREVADMTGVEIPFTGVRLRFDSTRNFASLVDALLADVGRLLHERRRQWLQRSCNIA